VFVYTRSRTAKAVVDRCVDLASGVELKIAEIMAKCSTAPARLSRVVYKNPGKHPIPRMPELGRDR